MYFRQRPWQVESKIGVTALPQSPLSDCSTLLATKQLCMDYSCTDVLECASFKIPFETRPSIPAVVHLLGLCSRYVGDCHMTVHFLLAIVVTLDYMHGGLVYMRGKHKHHVTVKPVQFGQVRSFRLKFPVETCVVIAEHIHCER
jgi:hypothetical protein